MEINRNFIDEFGSLVNKNNKQQQQQQQEQYLRREERKKKINKNKKQYPGLFWFLVLFYEPTCSKQHPEEER